MKPGSLLLFFAPVLAAAPVTWTGPANGDQVWNNPANWSTGAVPGPSAEVTVAVPGTLRVLLPPGLNVTVARLTGTNAFLLNDASLSVTAGTSLLTGPVAITNSSLVANNPGTRFTLSGDVTTFGANLHALKGAVLAMNGLRTYEGGDRFAIAYNFRADGAGSLLDLSGVTDLRAPSGGFATLTVTAGNGGWVNLALLPQASGSAIRFLAEGANSLLDLSSLSAAIGPTLEARNQGSLLCPALTSLEYATLSLSDTALLPTDQISTAKGSTLIARGGANLAFPALRTYDSGDRFAANTILRAEDAGSRLDLSGVTNLVAATGQFAALDLSARAGGQLLLTNLTQITQGYSRATAEGAGSRIDFSRLTDLVGQQWEAKNGGQIRNPVLRHSSYSVLILRDTAQLNLATLTNLTGSSLYATGGATMTFPLVSSYDGGALNSQTLLADNPGSALVFPALTRFAGATAQFRLTDVQARHGGRIQLPLITSLGEGFTAFSSADAGSRMELPQLTALLGTTFEAARSGTFDCPQLVQVLNSALVKRGPDSVLPTEKITTVSRTWITASDGANLRFPLLTRYDSGTTHGSWLIESVHAGSLIDFPALTRFVGPTAGFSVVEVRSRVGGRVRMPGITTLGEGSVAFSALDADSRLELPNLATLTGGSLEVRTGGSLDCPKLADVSNAALLKHGATSSLSTEQISRLTRSSLRAQEGAILGFPKLSTYDAGTGSGSWSIEASDLRTVIEFPALTQFTGALASFSVVNVRATAGAVVALPRMVALGNGAAEFFADGVGSVLDLPNLRSIFGFSFEARAGGTINCPNLAELANTALTLRGPNSFIPTANITAVSRASLMAFDGAVLAFPKLLQYDGGSTQGSFQLQATGAGSLLDLSQVTAFRGVGAQFSIVDVSVNGGGRIALNRVGSLDEGSATFRADGVNSRIDLDSAVTATFKSFDVRNGATLNTPKLLQIDRSSLFIVGAGNTFPVDRLQTVTDSSVQLDKSSVSFSSVRDVRGSNFNPINGGKAIFPPAANLQVTDIIAPPAALGGAPVTLVWEVRNNSTNPVTGVRRDGLALRRTGSPDVSFGTVEISNELLAQTSRRYTHTVIVPSGLTGVWQFVVTADAGFGVYEGNQENDNSLVDDAPIGLSSPDLVVTETRPAMNNTLFGTTFNVTWVVKNQGSTNAPALWEDWILLSKNQNDFSAAVPLGSLGAPKVLTAGESYTNQASVTAPLLSTLPPGNYFIAVIADGRDVQFEANEANNGRTAPLTLANPPLPDLAAINVTAPAEALPGQRLTVRYVVTNRGPVTATGSWLETIGIGSAAHPDSSKTVLATALASAPIPPGGSQERTQQLVLPADFIPAVDWHVVVTVDRDGAVVETDEANNATTAIEPTAVPAGLTLFIPQGTIAENAVPPTFTGQIVRNGDLTPSVDIALASSRPAQLAVPATVTIPAGQASAEFPLTVLADGLATPDHVVDLTASAPGRRAAGARVTVANTDPTRLTLEFTAPSVGEGRTASARVTRNGFLDQPLTLTLGSSSPGRLLPPANVTLAPGATNAVVAFVALDNLVLEPAQTVSASVGAAGYPSAAVDLTILDDDLPTLEFTLAKAQVSEGAGTFATTARIRRDRNLNAALIVRITSSDPHSLQVPETILLPAGQSETTFPVGAIANELVDGPRTVTVAATATHTTTGEPTGPSVTQSLTVTDDDGPTLSLTLARRLVGPGLTPATTAIIRRNTGTNVPLVVTLDSSAPTRANVPASVMLGAGVAEAQFPINTPVGAVPGGRAEVTLTATAPGFSPGADSLIVSDLNQPDLLVSQITAPQTALTKAQVSLGWQVRNQGLASAKGKLRQRVYLSPDPSLDAADPLVTEQELEGELPPGLAFTFVRTIFLPPEPGDYWVIVRTDTDDLIAETLEDNNLGTSAQPIRVSPGYAATDVSVDLTTGASGQPVEIRGRLLRTGSSEPAAFEVAAIHVWHDGLDRLLGALTDADGHFAATFRSGASEVGFFEVAVGHPEVARPPVQAQFTLVGFVVEGPTVVTATLESGTPFQKRFNIGARSPRPLTDIKAAFINLPPGMSGTAQPLVPVLIPDGGTAIVYQLTTTPELAGRFQFSLRLTSAEGARLDVPFAVDVRPPQPLLEVTPTPLIAGMVRGRQNQVELAVTNRGNSATGPLSLALPALPWLASATPLPAPSLAPGEGTVFRLLLTPPDDLPLTIYTGEIGVVSPGSTVRVPSRFRAVSTAVGDLEITAEDEYTYYAAGAPRVAQAQVQLLDPFDASRVLREIATDSAGFAALRDVPEGVYLLRVTAPKHTRRELRVEIAPGLTRQTRVLLPAETVVYEWTVQATEIPDSYRFTIDAKFETNVPFPVVTAEPFLVPLVFPGEITQTSITLTNHGLIAAQGVRLRARSTSTYLITPLFTDVGDIPAHSSITVPVLVQLQPELDADFVGRLQQQGRWPQVGAEVQPAVYGGLELHPARFLDRNASAARRALPAGLPLPAAGPGGNNCEKPSLEALYFVICGPDGVLHGVSIDIRPITMLKELNACLKAIAEGAGKGLAGVPKAICDCASTVAAGLGGSVPPEIKCLCAFIGLDGGGIAECLCPEIPPGELYAEIGGGGFGAFQPLALPSGSGGKCQIIPTGGGTSAARASKPAARAALQPLTTQAENGICATVKLRLEQDLVLTRSAIRATLGLENRLGTPLTALSFRIDFFDRSGRNANALFGGPPPILTGLSALDGTGTLAANTTGTAAFTLVPSVDAAPDGETPYTVGGELQYEDATGIVTITLQPVPIQVLPQPRLLVDYFHQRDVFSDDPHTPEIEPSEPYTLAVLLRNVGQGPANAIHLTSAQPTIIENEKGLLVDFQIVATETFSSAGLRALTPSLTADLGDLPAGGVTIGRWLLKSSLQGLFTDYSARFEHLDGLGQRNLSLVDPNAVKIHELTHLIRDVRPGADALPDFLVNDDFATDPADLPDSVYLSTGAIEPVIVVTEASADGVPTAADLRIELSWVAPAGWAYIRVPDPQGATGKRQFRLARVLRSDGVLLESENFWQTDRTFIGEGRRPLRENRLHLLDHGSTGRYTLIYEPIAPADLASPASQVAELPAQAFADFPVTWTGADGRGQPVTFDIYVSVDDAPFSPWLRNTGLSGAFYPGTPGHHYAFYSVATDATGRREAAPAAADATTRTTLINTAPTWVAIATQNLIEGELFSLRLAATDLDVPAQKLEFQLGPGTPAGLTLDPASGNLQWLTGEGNGPSTNLVTVLVRDNGSPSLSDTYTFLIIVHETNSAPSLEAVPDAFIREGVTYSFTPQAADLDVPANRLMFSLAPGAPVGATVDATTGRFAWQPSRTQGPSTNEVTLVVRDDGTPPLSRAQTFTLVVRDTEADFRLRVGRTNLFAGASQSVAVHLQSGDSLAALEFKLQTDPRLLTDLQLLPGIPGLESAVLQPTQLGEFKASLTFGAEGLPAVDADIVRLAFGTAADASGIAPLVPSSVLARDLEGRTLRGAGSAGWVVVVSDQPILLAEPHPATGFVLFGRPGQSYDIDSTTSLDGIPTWQIQLGGLPLNGEYRVVPLPEFETQIFFRARPSRN